jgi:predicted extracellular nuclease
MEIENDGYDRDSAIQDLVYGLNSSYSKRENVTYKFIDPGRPKLGNDIITVGIIYNTQTVKPISSTATNSNGAFSENSNRQPLAQTFEELSTGERLTIAVNHFKSKGGGAKEAADKDKGDGQGSFNGARTKAANELTDWLRNCSEIT